MQSKNQVVIMGISIFEKPEQVTVWPIELKKSSAIPLCRCRLDFKLYSLFLHCSGRVQSKNGADLVEVSIKSEKMSGQTVQPKKIYTVALLYLCPPNLLIFFVAFTVLWTYPVQK